ncbi:hypothetical protein EAH89_14170 [Roseomonas nepalensis]|uniref:Uncharacterized protein n=1 Tax=Muricoccus nepalensis TaxID=1854500 RepID=A0A502G2B3_9PROT|nr:hypothetical protein EAH89_14170 [Roseomonas nepalensis]
MSRLPTPLDQRFVSGRRTVKGAAIIRKIMQEAQPG